MDEVLAQVPGVLSHPFVLALVTAFFVNGLTRTWQDRQKAVEVATGLVAAMSVATMTALLAADRASRMLRPKTLEDGSSAIRPPSETSEERRKRVDELTDAREAWERDSAVLGTKLEAYYPSDRTRRPEIAKDWTSFSERVRESMSESYSQEHGSKEWPAQLQSLHQEKARLIRLVLEERPAGFDRGWLPWRNPLVRRR
jgi:hypothetical protein